MPHGDSADRRYLLEGRTSSATLRSSNNAAQRPGSIADDVALLDERALLDVGRRMR
jgi:hypothetical protein